MTDWTAWRTRGLEATPWDLLKISMGISASSEKIVKLSSPAKAS